MSTAESIPPLAENAQLHLLGEEGILFRRIEKRLYYLNTTASYIWCSLAEGLEPAQIASGLAEQFGIPLRVARKDIQVFLRDWSAGALPTPMAVTTLGNHTAGKAGTLPSKTYLMRHYLLGGAVVCIRYPSQDAEVIVHPALHHLEIWPERGDERLSIDLEIQEIEGRFRLVRNQRVRGEPVSQRELIPLVHQQLLTAVYESTDCLAGLHAGAVCGERGCILFPGAPGSGKSTLIAALMSSGVTYLTDELVLVMPDGNIRPQRISLGLKRGSWPLLTDNVPMLDYRPIQIQADGTEVRYLNPPAIPASAENPRTVRALVFPRYVPGAKCRLAPLSPAKTFARLAEAGYAVPGALDSEVVSALLEWVSARESYELEMDDLGSAVSKVRELLR